MPLPFWIVDVFAEEKYAGNQLAVFTQADHLTTEEMQQIAREINFSETTFIIGAIQEASPPTPQGAEGRRQKGHPPIPQQSYEVRIFTPKKELPFAGHPTLGTAYVIQQEFFQEPVEEITLNLEVGQIPVTLTYHDRTPEVLWMRQKSPEFGAVLSAEAIAPVLSLAPDDIDPRFPVQEVSTGIPFLIVPLKTLTALQRIKVNSEELGRLTEPLQTQEVFVFCPETRHPANHFSARMFAPLLGIAEDPATGSANGCFAGYLMQYAYLGEGPLSVQVEQGYEMGRPSLLRLQAQQRNDSIEVNVGGRVIPVARGEFLA